MKKRGKMITSCGGIRIEDCIKPDLKDEASRNFEQSGASAASEEEQAEHGRDVAERAEKRESEQFAELRGGIPAPDSAPSAGTTELVFIVDRSGSMAGLESDTVGGFNSMIEKQKREGGECYVSTFLFNHEIKLVHDRIRLSEVTPMTERDYTVGGCTALLDAIGDAIGHIGNIHRYARREDVPQSTVFVITTDGLENVSRRYTADSQGTRVMYDAVAEATCYVRRRGKILDSWSEQIAKDHKKRGR